MKFLFRGEMNFLKQLYHKDPEMKFHFGSFDRNEILFRGLGSIT